MIPFRAALAIAVVPLCLVQTANAVDWDYCIAPSDNNGRIYISVPFAESGTASAEASFRRVLDGRHLAYDAVQCARAGDDQSAADMRRYAISVNRFWGRKVIELPWPRR